MMRKKKDRDADETSDPAASPHPTPAALVMPDDIQRKEFRVARVGGYRMNEVDEFLDDVTRTMGELISENERLRTDGRSADANPSPLTSGAGIDAVRPFLDRERDFLRSLGSLVQDHMEAVREMARSAPPTADAPVGASAVTAPGLADGPHVAPAEGESEAAGGREARATQRGPDVARPAAAPAAGPALTEPIHVQEAQPAGALRADDGGLRELFWGEED